MAELERSCRGFVFVISYLFIWVMVRCYGKCW